MQCIIPRVVVVYKGVVLCTAQWIIDFVLSQHAMCSESFSITPWKLVVAILTGGAQSHTEAAGPPFFKRVEPLHWVRGCIFQDDLFYLITFVVVEWCCNTIGMVIVNLLDYFRLNEMNSHLKKNTFFSLSLGKKLGVGNISIVRRLTAVQGREPFYLTSPPNLIKKIQK